MQFTRSLGYICFRGKQITNLGGIGLFVERVTADFLQFPGTIAKISLLGGRLGIHIYFQAFQKFSENFLTS